MPGRPPSPREVGPGLLKAAIRDDNPVIFFEQKMLYGVKGEVPDGNGVLPLGKAAVVREGSAVTIVAAMATVGVALQAAEQLEERGIDAEVIDLRTLRPLDEDAIAASAAQTRSLVVVEEGPPTGGYAADVLALAVERVEGMRALRVCAPDTPVPLSGPLEDWWRPGVDQVVDAAAALVR